MGRSFKYAIIDLDLPVYKAAASAQKTFYDMYNDKGEFVETYPSADSYKEAIEELEDFLMVDTSGYKRESRVVVGEFEEATRRLHEYIKDYLDKANAEKGMYYIGGDSSTNFRHDVATFIGYKSTRSQEKPYHFYDLVEYAKDEFDPVIAEGVECDDLVSIAIYEDYKKGLEKRDNSLCECVLVSIDKDSKVTPGWHLNPDKDDEPVWISTKDAAIWLYTMALGGDTADSIKGAPGYGYKKAEKALSDCRNEAELWEKTVEIYDLAFRKECGKKNRKDKALTIDDEGNLTYTTYEGEVITRHISDVAEENMYLVYMLRESTDERWERPDG